MVHVTISYNSDDDYLEVVFSDAVGNVIPTDHPLVDQSLDSNGSLLGFWIRDISKLSTSKPFSIQLDSIEVRKQAYNVAEIQKEHQSAYEKWTPEEDEGLERAYKAGVSIASLANTHRRNRGAITSRLRKLGLEQP